MRARMLICSLAWLALAPTAGAAVGDLTYAGSSVAGTIAMPVGLTFAGDHAYLVGGNGSSDGIVHYARDSAAGTLGLAGDERGIYGVGDVTAIGQDLYVSARSGGSSSGRLVHRRLGTDGATGGGGCWGSSDGCTAMADDLAHAVAVAVAPDGANVYVVDQATPPRVVEFDRDATSGTLTEGTCAGRTSAGCTGLPTDRDALTQPTDVVVAPDGAHVYVADPPSGAVSWWTRGADGTLTFGGCIASDLTIPAQTGCTAGPNVGSIARIVMSPDGRDVYGTTGFNSALVHLRRDVATGALTQVGCDGNAAGCDPLPGSLQTGEALSNVTSLVMAPDGASVYAAGRYADVLMAFARDAGTGALAFAGCDEPSNTFGTDCADFVPTTDAGRGSRGAIAVSADGRTVAIGGYSGGGVASFVREVAVPDPDPDPDPDPSPGPGDSQAPPAPLPPGPLPPTTPAPLVPGPPTAPPAPATPLTLRAAKVVGTVRAGKRRTIVVGVRASAAGRVRLVLERRSGRRWVRVVATTVTVRPGANRVRVRATVRTGAHRVRLGAATARFTVKR